MHNNIWVLILPGSGLVTLCALFSLCLSGQGCFGVRNHARVESSPKEIRMKTVDETVSSRLPELDQQIPSDIETATFALG